MIGSTDRTAAVEDRHGFGAVTTPKELREPVPPPPVRELDRSLLANRGAVEFPERDTKPAIERPISDTKERTAETVAALEKAKEDIGKALNIPPKAAEAPPPPPPPPVEEEEEVVLEEVEVVDGDEEQLFVVEERMIRGRPARVLSDGTVEAETDEGWMRFENLEHLEEYLDAMSPRKV